MLKGWLSYVVPMTYYSMNSVSGEVPLTNGTINTVKISKYFDLVLYETFLFKYNSFLYHSEPGRWLGIPQNT